MFLIETGDLGEQEMSWAAVLAVMPSQLDTLYKIQHMHSREAQRLIFLELIKIWSPQREGQKQWEF